MLPVLGCCGTYRHMGSCPAVMRHLHCVQTSLLLVRAAQLTNDQCSTSFHQHSTHAIPVCCCKISRGPPEPTLSFLTARQPPPPLVPTQAALRNPAPLAFCREAVIGLVLVKELVLIDMFANIPVSALSMRPIPQLRADTAMYDLLKLFQTGRTHMVLLTRPPAGAKLLAAQAAGSATSRADLAVNIEPHTIKKAAEEVCSHTRFCTRVKIVLIWAPIPGAQLLRADVSVGPKPLCTALSPSLHQVELL